MPTTIDNVIVVRKHNSVSVYNNTGKELVIEDERIVCKSDEDIIKYYTSLCVKDINNNRV